MITRENEIEIINKRAELCRNFCAAIIETIYADIDLLRKFIHKLNSGEVEHADRNSYYYYRNEQMINIYRYYLHCFHEKNEWLRFIVRLLTNSDENANNKFTYIIQQGHKILENIDLTKMRDMAFGKKTTTEIDAIQEIKPDNTHPENLKPSQVIMSVTIYSPVFNSTKAKWKFKYGIHIIEVDISKTDLAQRILNTGYVSLNHIIKVKMEIRKQKTQKGYKNRYTILSILEYNNNN